MATGQRSVGKVGVGIRMLDVVVILYIGIIMLCV